MLEECGDLWALAGDVRCITTNGQTRRDGACVMGRGCALQAKERFPGIDFCLGGMILSGGNRVHELPHGLVSFPVKHHWRDRASPALIAQSATDLRTLANARPQWKRILIPRPGCGNGHLRWNDVRPVLASILTDDRFVIVTNEPS